MILEIILFTQLLKPIPEQPVFPPIETSLQLPLGAEGIYFYNTKQYLCTDFDSCYHEIGHLVDHENDMISIENDFINAIEWYEETASLDDYWKILIYPFTKNNSCGIYTKGIDSRYIELYATILEKSAYIQMPQEFMEFYDWGRIMEELETYKEHLVNEINRENYTK